MSTESVDKTEPSELDLFCYGVYLRVLYWACARLVCHRPGNHDESAGSTCRSIRRYGAGHRTDELPPTERGNNAGAAMDRVS